MFRMNAIYSNWFGHIRTERIDASINVSFFVRNDEPKQKKTEIKKTFIYNFDPSKPRISTDLYTYTSLICDLYIWALRLSYANLSVYSFSIFARFPLDLICIRIKLSCFFYGHFDYFVVVFFVRLCESIRLRCEEIFCGLANNNKL